MDKENGMALRHIILWTTIEGIGHAGEAISAIVQGDKILKRLPDNMTSAERMAAFRAFKKTQ
jgi:hypothetical protein